MKKYLLKDALEKGYAVGAFNFGTLEILKSIIKASEEKPYFTTNELRELLVSSGVHCYNNKNNVVNVGGGYLGVHSVADGEINIKLPKKYKVKSLLGIDLPECETDNISFNMKKHDTAMFELI